MDFGEVFRIMRRHWPISAPILLLTVLATVGMWVAWPTTYQSTAQITLLGPKSLSATQGNGNNPYLVVGDLLPMAGILSTNLSTPQAAQQLQAEGVPDTFTAVVPDFAAGPFLAITLEGDNPAEIVRSMPIAISFAEEQLRAMQENGAIQTPSAGIVGAAVIAQPSPPTRVLKKKIELVSGVFVLGLVAMFLFTFGAEARAVRRRKSTMFDTRRRKGATPGGTRQAPAGPGPAPAPAAPAPAPVSPAPAPVSPALAGVGPATAGVSPAPAPVSPAPAGVSQVSIGKPQPESQGLPQQNRQSVRVQ